MRGKHIPFVAREGIPFLLLSAIVFALAVFYLNPGYSVVAAVLLTVLFFIFRDPPRSIPASPLGVVSPIDGRVVSVDLVEEGVLHGKAHRVLLRINSFGTYTARSPVEGKIMDLLAVAGDETVDYQTNALWLQTDEGGDIVLQFRGYRFGLAPRAFLQFGQRVGQGQRSAYLRLTRLAELHLPITTKVLVEPGQKVVAGIDLIGKLMHS